MINDDVFSKTMKIWVPMYLQYFTGESVKYSYYNPVRDKFVAM